MVEHTGEWPVCPRWESWKHLSSSSAEREGNQVREIHWIQQPHGERPGMDKQEPSRGLCSANAASWGQS